jgi:non-specific serine/threonine protein kinase/serine/threonine-protein kinase
MTRDEWAQLEALFDEARQRTGSERAALLDRSSIGPETRRLLEQMLDSYDTDPDFLEGDSDPAGAVTTAVNDALVGQRLGAYRIVRPVGRGGMGVVYEAVRDDDEFARRVAIKVLPTWGATALASRFRLERRLLGSLDHPGIARLIDSGTAPNHGLYFVMEFVDGAPIDEWARTHGLDVDARVALLVRVADAVADAHRHLVVHRDLKPANILVQSDGQPKLLDFGIATLLSEEGAESASLTRTAERRFTPEFASPEQIRGEPVTTATDVYGLGALLYLLLAGRRPHDLRLLSPLEAMRLVCEVDPPAPSAVAPATDAPRVRGALDAVVQKALRKAPRERYTTVAELAADLRAWQAGLPVSAAPDSLVQQVRRVVRRHAVGVAASAAVLVALLVGGGVAIWQARVAERERARADARFNDVRKLANAVVGPLYDEISKVPGSTEARRALVKEALAYLDGLESQAVDDVTLKGELAEAYQKIGDVQGNPYVSNLGDVEGAKASFAKLMRLRLAVAAARPNDERARLGLASAHARNGDMARAEGRREDALDHFTRARTLVEATPGESLERQLATSRVNRGLGVTLSALGRPADALRHLETALAQFARPPLQSATSDEARREHATALVNMSGTLVDHGRSDDAVPYGRQALALAREILSTTSDRLRAYRLVYSSATTLCNALERLGHIDECLPVWSEGLDAIRTLASADPKDVRLRWDVATAYQGLAVLQAKKDRLDEAAASMKASLEAWTAAYETNPGVRDQRFVYAGALSLQAEIENARGNYLAAIDGHRRALAVYAEPGVATVAPVEPLIGYEAFGNTWRDFASHGGGPEAMRHAREAYQMALDGYERMRQAGTLTGTFAANAERVARKVALSTPRRRP